MSKKNSSPLFERIENILKNNPLIIILISTIISIVASLLMFNPDVSLGGDDSGYIKAGHDFVKGIAFPSWHGSMYSILLSFFILIFGVNIIALKLISVLFYAASFYFIYRVFSKIANHTCAAVVVIITSISCLLGKYAGTTYSESFFFFLQALFIYLFYNYLSKIENTDENYKTIWKNTLILGVLTYIMIQTRSISIAAFMAALAFLLLNKKYKSSLLYGAFTIASHFIFDIYKRIVWNVSSIGFEDQLNGMLLKNFYKPTQGNENLAGLITRFWDNSVLYFSKHLTKMFGVKPIDTLTVDSSLTIAIYLIIAVSVLIILLRNKKMGFIILYLAAMIGFTFVSLQKIWDQERLIMIYFPFILGLIAYALYLLFSSKKLLNLQIVPLALAVVTFILVTVQTATYISKNSPDKRFVSGEFQTFTPDWQNYMLASKWAAGNLDDKAVVACRKPDMSWIASEGKDIFKGIYKVEYSLPDSAYNLLRELGATHVITANLRLDPRKKTDGIIRTVNNIISLVTTKYPGCLTLLKEFGDDEKAYVFKLDFPGHTSGEGYLKSLDGALFVNYKNLFIHQKKAEYYIEKGDYQTAIQCYTKGIETGTDDELIYFNRGYCYFQMNKFQEGINDFRKSVELNPSFGHAWYNIAVSLFNTGDYKGAADALAKSKGTNFKTNNMVLEDNLAKLGY